MKAIPACKACGEWFAKARADRELCCKCEMALGRLVGYVVPATDVVPIQDLKQLRDELYENDAILMSGLRMLNQFIAEHEK